MADNLLNTSIAAIASKIATDVATATVDQLVDLTRAAAAIGHDDNTTIETAVNTRVNALLANATIEDVKKLGDVIKKMRSTSGGGSSTFVGLSDTPNSLGAAGEIVKVNSGATALEFVAESGGASVNISDTAPSNPVAGDMWYDSSDGSLSVYYTDADSSQWVAI